jgi:hypothetical protein
MHRLLEVIWSECTEPRAGAKPQPRPTPQIATNATLNITLTLYRIITTMWASGSPHIVKALTLGGGQGFDSHRLQ